MPSATECEYKPWDYVNTVHDPAINCKYDIENPEWPGEDAENPDDIPESLPNDDRHWKTFQSIVSEIFGTFIYVLFFMITTDEKLRFSPDSVKNSLVIAGSFVSSQLLAGGQYVTMHTGPCLNPATAFGLALF